MKTVVVMCPACGDIAFPDENEHSYDICDYCGMRRILIDGDGDAMILMDGDETTSLEEKLQRKYLFTHPQFNEELYEARMKKNKDYMDALRKDIEELRRKRSTPKCPYCNSFYVEKITTGSRFLSTVMFGLGSSKVGKQWHCRQCESNF